MRVTGIALALTFVLISATIGCRSSAPVERPPVPGHGAISIEVVPNPIVAKRITGDTFEFPFDLVVKETGGHPVNITRIEVTVYALGGLPVGSDTWDAERIRGTGTSTAINAMAEARFHFAQRRDVPDERYFRGVSAKLVVEGTDDVGATASATTSVTVSK